ncbi:MAG: outer membrane protein assembly factor BamA [Thermodesulfobacteriota bacterium]|nr:MAG: outer membrane protein assembly factor BamA [Thermodesulfobacteriota bacterium]
MRLTRPALIIFFLLLLFPGFAQGKGPHIKVLILPLDMHSRTDISSKRRVLMDALATGLKSQGAEIVGIDRIKEIVLKGKSTGFDEKAAIEISKSVPADFAVLGSITALGRTMNVDLRVFDLKGEVSAGFYSRSSRSLSDLVGTVRETSAEMYEKMISTLREKPVEKKGVVDKVVIAGNRRVDTYAIKKKITSKAGEPYSPDSVKEDIRALYGMGYFEDISVDLSDTASGKVLTFNVKERPFIKSIVLKGNKDVTQKKIMDAITIKEGTVLDRTAVGENTERIKAVYAKEGFYLAEVDPEIKSEGSEAMVVFNIKEGEAVKVKRITIIGNKHFSDKKLKAVMSTKEVWLFSFVTQSAKFDEFLFQNDLALILGKYYDNGYINVAILDHRVLLSENKRWFYITISLKEGEKYNFGDIDISGEILGRKKDLLDKIKIKSGEVFNRAKLTRDMDALSDVYGDKGYAYVEIKPLTVVHPDKKTVDIKFDIKKNDLVYIEKINIAGNSRTRDKVIRRELEAEEEQLYSSSALKRSKGNLKRLGYFDDVSIQQTRGSASDRMDLTVKVQERPTGAVSAGIGYSSVDNIIGTASISQSNFMGTGVKLDLSGTVSSASSRYILGFTQPWLMDKPISAGFDIYNTESEFEDFTTSKKGFDVRLGSRLFDKYTRAYISYTLEEVNVFDVADTASTFIKDQEGFNTESSVKLTLKRDTRDDAFFPREGAVLTYSVKFSGGPLGGTIYMIKNELDAVKFFPLPMDMTFSIRGAMGYVQGYDGREPPIYERFFLGGINTIRGFDTRTVSPKDEATGDLIGGNTMIQSNIELLFPLVPAQKLRGLVFFDAGNSYKGRIDFSDIRTSVGLGVRWYSPFGPLRVELGINLDRRDDEKRAQWDFTMGTSF